MKAETEFTAMVLQIVFREANNVWQTFALFALIQLLESLKNEYKYSNNSNNLDYLHSNKSFKYFLCPHINTQFLNSPLMTTRLGKTFICTFFYSLNAPTFIAIQIMLFANLSPNQDFVLLYSCLYFTFIAELTQNQSLIANF